MSARITVAAGEAKRLAFGRGDRPGGNGRGRSRRRSGGAGRRQRSLLHRGTDDGRPVRLMDRNARRVAERAIRLLAPEYGVAAAAEFGVTARGRDSAYSAAFEFSRKKRLPSRMRWPWPSERLNLAAGAVHRSRMNLQGLCRLSRSAGSAASGRPWRIGLDQTAKDDRQAVTFQRGDSHDL